MSNPSNGVLVIVGMHRSMTSLAAQWLHACGLNVGDDLYGADYGNPKGHFEDNDFIGLHDYMLKINDSHWRDTTRGKFQFDIYSKQKSRMLIRLKSKLYAQWGWKDPRTCLFLDHWNSLLPDAKYLIMFRPYTEVVDSLVRREFKVKSRVEYVIQWRKYVSKFINLNRIKKDNLRLWIHYNRSILDFVQRIKEDRYIVIRDDHLLKNTEKIFRNITEDWEFDLDYVPVESIFDAGITKKAPAESLKNIDAKLLKKAVEIEDQLASYSEFNS